jgi:L-ribulose-5-phosphate 3-epimerase
MAQSFICNTFSFIWKQPFHDCIERFAELGFNEFEVLLTAPHLWPEDCDAAQRRRLVQKLEASDARIASLNAGGFDNNLASPGSNVRAFAQRYLRDTIDLAADLGARDVVMAPGMGRGLLPPPKDAMLGWLREGLEMLARHAESRNVRLLMENVPFSFLPRVDQMMAAIEGLPPERVGIVYDVANAVFVGEDPVEGLKAALPRVHLVHLSDTPMNVWRHDPVGRGVVPFERFASALRELNCTSPLVLEIITDSPERDICDSASALVSMGYTSAAASPH